MWIQSKNLFILMRCDLLKHLSLCLLEMALVMTCIWIFNSFNHRPLQVPSLPRAQVEIPRHADWTVGRLQNSPCTSYERGYPWFSRRHFLCNIKWSALHYWCPQRMVQHHCKWFYSCYQNIGMSLDDGDCLLMALSFHIINIWSSFCFQFFVELQYHNATRPVEPSTGANEEDTKVKTSSVSVVLCLITFVCLI